jgi:hypothetical protein
MLTQMLLVFLLVLGVSFWLVRLVVVILAILNKLDMKVSNAIALYLSLLLVIDGVVCTTNGAVSYGSGMIVVGLVSLGVDIAFIVAYRKIR